MLIIPAIDLKGGKCVRLRQGKADDEKVYSDDPVEMARRWVDQGAEYLHVVDLDGAFEGKPVHTSVVADIAAAIPIPVELGGGMRTTDDVAATIDAGVSRVIIGTRAVTGLDFLSELVARYGDAIAVGIDARDGMVQVKGWVETTGTKASDLAAQVEQAGVKTVIYTDTATDGMMRGTNAPAMKEICEAVRCDVVASGGVSSVNDVSTLKSLEKANLIGVIVGKALYEGTVTLKELIAV